MADEVVEAVASSRHPLPASLQELVTSLALLDDAGLQRAAQRHLPERAAQQLEALNHKRQREGLTPSEEETLATLLAQYEQYLLVRAEAASLLKKRGYDVSYLLENDEREG